LRAAIENAVAEFFCPIILWQALTMAKTLIVDDERDIGLVCPANTPTEASQFFLTIHQIVIKL